MNKIVLVIIILIVIVGGYFFLQNNKETTDVPASVDDELTEEKTFIEFVLENEMTQIASLSAVDGSDSSGTGYRLIEKGKLFHVVLASMPDPEEGNSYEGWLVQPNPLKFFSTGVMEKNQDGLWILEYTTENEVPTYNRVVITEETIVDETPEKHIIEGDFEQIEVSENKVREFTMTAKQWEFIPSNIVVSKGDIVKLHIESIDVEHGIALPDFGINEDLPVGEIVDIEFLADKAGTFVFRCSVFCGSGHTDMTGQLVVE